MQPDESRQLCVGIITCGFTASNDIGNRLKFVMDDVTIKHRDHMWQITDPVNGMAGYISLKDLIENEAYRFDYE